MMVSTRLEEILLDAASKYQRENSGWIETFSKIIGLLRSKEYEYTLCSV